MNDQQRAAMQMALEALESWKEWDAWNKADAFDKDDDKAITALREALAQPKKPDECANGCPERTVCDYCTAQPQGDKVCIDWDAKTDTPVMGYKAQPQGEWVDLTDDEILEASEDSGDLEVNHWRIEYCREVIAKFKEKNTPPVVPQGEPVAWIEHEWSGTGSRELHFERRVPSLRDEVVRPVWTPLYTTPPSIEAAIEATKEKAIAALQGVATGRLDVVEAIRSME